MNKSTRLLAILIPIVALLPHSYTYPDSLSPAHPKSDLIGRTEAGQLLLYPFYDGSFQGSGRKAGHGFNNFTHYFVGDWYGIGHVMDLIVRTTDGRLLLYPFYDGSFQGSGIEVGHGFNNFTHYFIGQWHGRINSNDDLIVRTTDGRLLLYPFYDGSFHGSGIKVGHGFNNFTHYFVGEWHGAKKSKDDLIVRTTDGRLLLYPFYDGSFHGSGIKAGHGFNFTHYFFANWAESDKHELIGRTNDGKLLLYPFADGSFHGSGIEVGHGFNNFTHYFIGEWHGEVHNKLDLIVRTQDGRLLLYPFCNGTFYGNGKQVVEGFYFKDYFIGDWVFAISEPYSVSCPD